MRVVAFLFNGACAALGDPGVAKALGALGNTGSAAPANNAALDDASEMMIGMASAGAPNQAKQGADLLLPVLER